MFIDKLSFYGIAVVIAPGIAPVVCSYATVNQGWRVRLQMYEGDNTY